jgi:thioredoxin 1
MVKSFEGHINGDIPVVVDFGAAWCGPSKLMEPVLHELRQMVGERAAVVQLDIDKLPQYAEQYDVRSVPTLIIIKGGKILWRKNGVTTAHEILQHLNAYLS